MKQKETNLVNWYRRLILILLILTVSACAVNETAREAIILTQDDIPPITGVDSDLWSNFVESVNLPDCQLPCWWSFEIGITSQDEVANYLQQMNFDRSQARSPYPDAPFWDYISASALGFDFLQGRSEGVVDDVIFHFSFDDTVLRSININMARPSLVLREEDNPLLITSLLNEFDSNPTMLISAPRNARISNFTFILVYPEYNFQVLYHLDIREAYPLICLNSDNIRYLALDITNYPNELVEESDVFIPIDDSWLVRGSDITTEEFIQFFRDNPDSCLDLSQYPSEE